MAMQFRSKSYQRCSNNTPFKKSAACRKAAISFEPSPNPFHSGESACPESHITFIVNRPNTPHKGFVYWDLSKRHTLLSSPPGHISCLIVDLLHPPVVKGRERQDCEVIRFLSDKGTSWKCRVRRCMKRKQIILLP